MDPKQQAKTKQNIILDSNIIQYSAERNASPIFVPYLIELSQRGFGFAISDITIHELLKGANIKNESEMLALLNAFQRYFLTDNVLIASARLETIYKIEGIEQKQIEDGDKFIAATAILTGSLILTANARDFPSPYFQELERKPLIYSDKKRRSKCILVSLLAPDISMVNQRFSQRPKE